MQQIASQVIKYVLIILVAQMISCAPRGIIQYAQPVGNATIQPIWVANFRDENVGIKNYGMKRSSNMSFQRLDISIPPAHQLGLVEWPKNKNTDPEKFFVTVNRENYSTLSRFGNEVKRSDKSRQNETILYIHGYNNTYAESVYQLAQIRHDFQIRVPTMLFAWPSAAEMKGYIYDRDSTILSRGKLEAVITELTKDRSRKVFLSCHSMGCYLLMETLRQISFKKRYDILSGISGIVFLSPDIDTEVFVSQTKDIKNLPKPFVVIVATQDRALKFAEKLTGKKVRLGNSDNFAALKSTDVTLVDVSAFADGRNYDHTVATSSPAAISFLEKLMRPKSSGEAHLGRKLILGEVKIR